MGRMLGAFDNPEELDRPDLNKCPDCECFFAGEACPLCGKICPEEMRAGNRKPPKKEKRRRASSSGRVTFVEWYHSWWFIILMMFFMPIVGIILLATSPHDKHKKITFIVIACVYTLITTVGLGTIIGGIKEIIDPPVNTRLSQEEYVAKCDETDAGDFWHAPDEYKDKYVKMRVVVSSSFEDVDAYPLNGKYTLYYVCKIDGSDKYILVRSCIQGGASNFTTGDVITIYGEGAGRSTVYDYNFNEYSAPCVNAAYVKLEQTK